MTKILNARSLLAAALLWAASSLPGAAQTSPGWSYGYVPTVAQWNAVFAAKQDYLGAPPLLLSGGTMSGRIVTAASNTSRAGINFPAGVAPSAPIDGDMWATTTALLARINGVTYNLLSPTGLNLVVGSTTVSSGTTTRVLYDNAGVLGEYAISGTGSVAMTNGPTFVAPVLGAASATSLSLTNPLTVPNGGSGAGTFTSNAFLTGGGTSAFNAVAITGLVLGNGASAPTGYAGSSCTNQAGTAISAVGALTCSSITNAFLTAGTFSSITGTGTLTAGATGAGFTIALTTSTVTGTIPSANVSGSYTGITGTGTLTAGATGSGFTVALASSTITGTLALTNGGAGGSLTASNGGIVYSDASRLQILAGTVTANQCLLSGASSAPSWGSCAGGASVTSIAGNTGAFTLSTGITNSTNDIRLDKATSANLEAGTSNKALTADIIYDAAVNLGTTVSGSVTWDFNTFLNATTTLTGNVTALTCSNIKASQSGSIVISQDGTGSRTMVAGWCSQFRWAGGSRGVLSTTASAADTLFYQCVSTSVCYVSLGKAQAN